MMTTNNAEAHHLESLETEIRELRAAALLGDNDAAELADELEDERLALLGIDPLTGEDFAMLDDQVIGAPQPTAEGDKAMQSALLRQRTDNRRETITGADLTNQQMAWLLERRGGENPLQQARLYRELDRAQHTTDIRAQLRISRELLALQRDYISELALDQ